MKTPPGAIHDGDAQTSATEIDNADRLDDLLKVLSARCRAGPNSLFRDPQDHIMLTEMPRQG
jgi:hypothetical protein